MSSFDTVLMWLDSAVCSQNPAHSFWIEGSPLPLCARDLGLFTGFLLGLAALRLWGPRWSWLYLLGLVPMLIDGANSFGADAIGLAIYQPNNWLRLATGVLGGVCLGVLLAGRHPEARGQRIFPGGAFVIYGAIAFVGLLSLADAHLAVALLGNAGVLAMAAVNNQLNRPMPVPIALSLAVPELALVAAVKQGLLLLVR